MRPIRTEASRHDADTSGGGWLSQFEAELAQDPDYVAEGLALEITEEAARVMKQRGISRAQLAEMMGVSRAYVTRVFNAPPNLTLRSVAQLAMALGGEPAVRLMGSKERRDGVGKA